MVERDEAPPIGVVVLAGYLGSGKTTLLSRLVARDAPNPIAVIVNDVGALDIDAALIAERSDGCVDGRDDGRNDGRVEQAGGGAGSGGRRGSISELIRLTNGCVCCTVADGFVTALRQIGELSPRPARLIIEASGMADPSLVADYAHLPGFRLDASLVLADATTIQARVHDRFVGRQVDQHLAAADRIVLTKCDLLDRTQLEAVRGWVADRWPRAQIFESRQGVLDWDAVLDGTGPEASPPDRNRESRDRVTGAAGNSRDDAVDLAPAHSVWTFEPDGPVDIDSVLAELAALSGLIPRAKGILRSTAPQANGAINSTYDLVLVSLASGRAESTPISGAEDSQVGLDVFVLTDGERPPVSDALGRTPAPTATAVDDAPVPTELDGLVEVLGEPRCSFPGGTGRAGHSHDAQSHQSHHHQGSHQ